MGYISTVPSSQGKSGIYFKDTLAFYRDKNWTPHWYGGVERRRVSADVCSTEGKEAVGKAFMAHWRQRPLKVPQPTVLKQAAQFLPHSDRRPCAGDPRPVLWKRVTNWHRESTMLYEQIKHKLNENNKFCSLGEHWYCAVGKCSHKSEDEAPESRLGKG